MANYRVRGTKSLLEVMGIDWQKKDRSEQEHKPSKFDLSTLEGKGKEN